MPLSYEYFERYNHRIVFSSDSLSITGGASTIVDTNLAADKALVSDVGGKVAAHASTTATHIGYLSTLTSNVQTQIDGKEPTLTKGNFTEVTSSVLTITGGTAAVIGSGLTVQVKQANGSQAGYLSSTDWTTFNSKLTSVLTNGYVFVGNGSNVATGVAVTGDITISNAGVTAISAGVIVNADVSATAAIAVSKLAAMTVSSAVATDSSGFLTTVSGVSATEVGYLANVTSDIQAQLDARLSVTLTSVATGDLIYYNGSAWVNLPRGTNGQALYSTATSIQWNTPTINGIPSAGTAKQVLAKTDSTDFNATWYTLDLTYIPSITASAAELNLLDGVTTSTAQLNYLNTATSDIQTQLNNKQSNSLAQGAMWVGNSSLVAAQLAPGSNGQVLTVVSGSPQWQTLTGTGTVTSVDVSGGTTGLTFSGGPVTTTGTITMAGTLAVANGGTGATSFTVGRVLLGNGTSAVTTDSSLFFDTTNDRLGIGTSSPSYALDISYASGSAQMRIHCASAGNPEIVFQRDANTVTNWSIYAVNGSTDLRIYTAGDKFWFTNTGNFGAGVSPTARVHARGANNGVAFLADDDAAQRILELGESAGVRYAKLDLGSDATGDIYYRNSSGNLTRLAIGTSSQVLIGGTTPSWGTAPGSISGLTANRIPYAASATSLTDDSALTWDATNNILTVDTIRFVRLDKSTDDLYIGAAAGNLTSTGTGANTGIGHGTLAALTSGNSNTALGRNALSGVTDGTNNTAVGDAAGTLVTGGDYNIFIGVNANGTTAVTGDRNVVIGSGLTLPSDSASGQLVIQNMIFGTGNTGTGTTLSTGSVGIGTSSPDRRFHVEVTDAVTSAVTYAQRLSHVTSGTAAASFGVGTEYELEVADGSNAIAATVDVSWRSVSAGTEYADYIVNIRRNGVLTERMRLGGTLDTGDACNFIYGRTILRHETATNNAVFVPLKLSYTSSNAPANGIGVGVEFEVETSAGNNEIGATIEAIVTDVTSTSEDFEVVVKTMVAGAAAAEQLRISDSGTEIGTAAAYYIGARGTNGSWRIIQSGDNLVFQQRESGVWNTKSTISGA